MSKEIAPFTHLFFVPCLVTSQFACKLCGAKQSVRRIYGRSHAAKDVRAFVQTRNFAEGTAGEAFDDNCFSAIPHGNNAGEVLRDTNGSQSEKGAGESNVEHIQSRWAPLAAAVGSKSDTGTRGKREEREGKVINEEQDENDMFVTTVPDSDTGKLKGSCVLTHKRGVRKRRRRGDGMEQNRSRDDGNTQEVPSRKRQTGQALPYPIIGEVGGSTPRLPSPSAHDEDDGVGFTLGAPGREEVVEDEIVF